MEGIRGEVAVIGLGRSGRSAVRLLRRDGHPVYGSDGGRQPALEATAAELTALGAAVEIGGHDLDRIGRAGLVVASPGVPPAAAPLAAARAAGVPIWAEAELGLRALNGTVPYAAITGTNGKTTTTALLAHLLVTGGRRAMAAGNIGTPLTEVALLEQRPETLAVELSSFQLHDMPSVAPAVGVLTNLAPDHLDRYPTLGSYYQDKLRLFANATDGSQWVINADDPATSDWLGPFAGRRLRFSVSDPADGWYDRAAGLLRLGDAPLIQRDRFPLLGDHNVANALAATLAAVALGIRLEAIGRGLATVVPLKHRMEPIREVRGVLWINDSKATNVASTVVAIRAMDRPFVLLLGGRHKGEPYQALGPLLGRCRAVIAYGEAKPLVVADLTATVPVIEGEGFDDVMARAVEQVRPGDAVLLSPACSSYDMFANYEERGARFRALVEAL
ncbi:MAG: UDP-N-acetylmuramoyl-L-alanine--D-glutamate ligase [Gemmatimonadales bacterium]